LSKIFDCQINDLHMSLVTFEVTEELKRASKVWSNWLSKIFLKNLV